MLRLPFRIVPFVATLSVALVLTSCGPEGTLDETEDGVPAEDTVGTVQGELTRPTMRMPFRCGQVWLASTYSSHSPQLAVDFNRTGDLGDSVVASARGTVSVSQDLGDASYGRWLEINHGNGYRTRYAHLSVRLVRVGQSVSAGQKIGEVGNTGGSSGAHLHYEQRLNGTPIRIILGATPLGYYEKQSYESRNGC